MIWTTRPRSELGGLAVIAAGSGPDVLLLHGVGLRAEAWNAQTDALAKHARVTAPDMIGHGQSPLPAAQVGLADYIAASAAVLRGLDGPALVVGHSMGAMIALELAAELPDHVLGVAALNAVFERSAEAARAVRARAAGLDGHKAADPSATLTRWFGATRTPEREACHDWLISVDPAAYKHAYTAFAHSNTPSQTLLGQLDCPALFVTGSLEPNSTPAMARAMADLTPRGQLRILDGAAHMMPMTHPFEVNATLLRFLEEVRT